MELIAKFLRLAGLVVTSFSDGELSDEEFDTLCDHIHDLLSDR